MRQHGAERDGRETRRNAARLTPFSNLIDYFNNFRFETTPHTHRLHIFFSSDDAAAVVVVVVDVVSSETDLLCVCVCFRRCLKIISMPYDSMANANTVQ